MNKTVLVAVEQLIGSTRGKDGQVGDKVVVNPGVELTTDIVKSLGLKDDDLTGLLRTGAIAEEKVRVAEEGIDAFAAAEIAALTKRAEEAEGALSAMEARATAAETRATDAEGKVTAADARATEAETALAAANTEIAALKKPAK